MQYLLSYYTDVGTKKPTNQDSLCVRRAKTPRGELLFAAVCDGMGGLARGELASAEVIRALGRWFDENVTALAACGGDFTPAQQQLAALIGQQNRRIAAAAAARGCQMGSTLTALLAVGGQWMTVNVGDSRVSAITGGQLQPLTQDQSLVAREVARGHITPQQAQHHPQRNVLLQCIGVADAVEPVFAFGTVQSGAVCLLCSDGLTHELSDAEICERLAPVRMQDRAAIQAGLYDLCERCKARGENDNLTGIAVLVQESPLPAPVKQPGVLRRLFGAQPQKTAEPPLVILETSQMVHTDDYIP